MRRDSKINQFIPLHFYEPSEKLPEDGECKIIVYKAACGDITYDVACYNKNRWYSLVGIIDDIIAWASFSPGWVTGSESFPEKWGSQ